MSSIKQLVGMMNRLIDALKTLSQPETIAELITEMTEYALEHFRAKGHLMAEYGYSRKTSISKCISAGI